MRATESRVSGAETTRWSSRRAVRYMFLVTTAMTYCVSSGCDRGQRGTEPTSSASTIAPPQRLSSLTISLPCRGSQRDRRRAVGSALVSIGTNASSEYGDDATVFSDWISVPVSETSAADERRVRLMVMLLGTECVVGTGRVQDRYPGMNTWTMSRSVTQADTDLVDRFVDTLRPRLLGSNGSQAH